MILLIEIKANWALLYQQWQAQINKNNQKENHACICHKYKVGDKVLLKKPGMIPKLETPRMGLYQVTQVYTNGTLWVQRGIILEHVNI